ncbi:MAG: 4-(cytidine 5'-diphospho)-2-C-methyl-D-erythritol kinase [Salinivirgaceae bacterium]|jgi:4-diphosphocytidyl-2-C-methyl-D-erythritol kinase|nr:4-(cytidine 5'-diphospho)-2-C-methyl-D-erythritol kinase [Salinivirgaceae bacterium]
MILYPNAKINIGLDILFKRDDGFHELETIMYPTGWTDVLTIKNGTGTNNTINFTSTGIIIDGKPENNLIVKAYQLINPKYELPSLDIHLHKSIPFGAGLGGGSADCAFTISGINSFCKLNLSVAEMEDLASELGSDCPFFIQNKPAIAMGRGELLESVNLDLSNYHIAIVIPPIPISTKEAYSLVKPSKPQKLLNELVRFDISDWKGQIKNDFEDSVFPLYPEIEKIKEKLYELDALYSALSGSGSAVFGIFSKKPDLSQIFPSNYFIWND